MEDLAEPNRLRTRILVWAEDEVRIGRPALKAGAILEAVLFRASCRTAMPLSSATC
jgi:hypothetical protein